MKRMETARYFVALALTATLPTVLLFWIVIHPLARLWRRYHPAVVYGVTLRFAIVVVVAIASQRSHLLATDWGTQIPLIIVGVGFLGISLWLRILIGHSLTTRQLVGIPELVAQSTIPKAGLVTTGIYGHLRHPRYAQLIIASWGYAFFANYPAAYVVTAVFIPAIYFVALLEEREMCERFGSAYAEYARRVPRFIPRRTNSHDCS